MPQTEAFNIREANLEDIIDISILGKEFYKEYYSNIFHWNNKKVVQNLESAIKKDDFLVLVLEKNSEIIGMFIGMVTECFFSNDIQASELAWYVSKDHRKERHSFKMIDYYEDWAKEKGASIINMMNITDAPSIIQSVYLRKGFYPKENTFIKEIR